MAKQLPDAHQPIFEQIKRLDKNGNEYWSARDLSKVLAYLEYRNFQPAIERAKDAGVIDPVDYAVFQNFGYQGLYGGLDARAIHHRKSLKKSQHILDHMGSTELAANLFRATQTEEKLRRENIRGKSKANQTHFEVGKKVRQTIKELGGKMPEDLPTEESIKKLEGGEEEGWEF
ncbi:MAG TPA: hypothetical protein PK228_21355 [Saprospiraceae bacterium]|nr:hypothetical protein [Saprospiraceae bacterium]